MPSRKDSRNNRPDHKPGIRQEYERHKKRILATQTICGICGQPVDMKLKYPHPGCPTIDHIIPVSRGGHPSALENLQLAHFRCNRMKFNQTMQKNAEDESFRGDRGDAFTDFTRPEYGLPWSIDWTAYRYDAVTGRTNVDELWEKSESNRLAGFSISINGITQKR